MKFLQICQSDKTCKIFIYVFRFIPFDGTAKADPILNFRGVKKKTQADVTLHDRN